MARKISTAGLKTLIEEKGLTGMALSVAAKYFKVEIDESAGEGKWADGDMRTASPGNAAPMEKPLSKGAQEALAADMAAKKEAPAPQPQPPSQPSAPTPKAEEEQTAEPAPRPARTATEREAPPTFSMDGGSREAAPEFNAAPTEEAAVESTPAKEATAMPEETLEVPEFTYDPDMEAEAALESEPRAAELAPLDIQPTTRAEAGPEQATEAEPSPAFEMPAEDFPAPSGEAPESSKLESEPEPRPADTSKVAERIEKAKASMARAQNSDMFADGIDELKSKMKASGATMPLKAHENAA